VGAPRQDWIEVAGGCGWMGGGPRREENPRHRVRISDFRLARTPVIRAAYQAFLDATGREAPPSWDDPAFAHPRLPAVAPSWDDAVAYCAWVSELWGCGVRLPTEAEWEWAARAGRAVLYPWGDAPPESLPDYERRWLEGPEPVDAYPSLHPLGFLGLGENVHEWCADWYDPDYYKISPRDNPQGPPPTDRKSARGGSWRHDIKFSRCAARSSLAPHKRFADFGFRLAESPSL
jgi:formylglycine-generating enzyme required for sulfatase activity